MFCDERAAVNIEGRWYCTLHAEMLEAAEARWSGINFFPTDFDEKQEVCGNLFDDEEEQ